MSAICKYVMLNKTEPVIFRAPIKHENINDLLSVNRLSGKNSFLANAKITSAAFFMVYEDGTVHVLSESTSLGIGPAPNDAAIIERFLKGTR